MALLGMSANEPCNGYFTGYYSTRDIIYGADGNTWTSSNCNGELKTDSYHNGFLPVPLPGHLLGYEKELLKQTILRHEAIFRDQIYELHRLYHKQREIMDEIRRNELYKHNLRTKISWSSSSLSHVSSKSTPKVCWSPKLPWANGESSGLIAESAQLPVGSVQEKGRQVCPGPCPAPIPVEEFLKDSRLSKSNYRKVGKKILDLQLPADEYIDSEEGESLEDERVSKVVGVSAYTLNGISQVEHNSDKKQYEANTNNFTDLNEPFELEEEAAVKSDDLVGDYHLRNIPLHELTRRTNLGPHNLPHDVIQYSKKRQDTQAYSDDPPPEPEKKHEQLSSTESAGQSGGDLNVFAEAIDTEKLSVSSESLNKKLEQINDLPCFHSLGQINQGPWSENFFSSGESSAGTGGPNSDGLVLGPCSAQLVSEDVGVPKNINLNVVPAVCSDTTAFQSIRINNKENKFHELRRGLPWLKKQPVPQRLLNEESKLSAQMEPVMLKHYLGGIHGFELKKTEESDLRREKILVFHTNGKPHTSSDLYSSHASHSKDCQNQTENRKIDEIGRGCVVDINFPCNLPDLGEQISDGECYMKNELEKKHKCLAGIIDLNSCLNEDEYIAIDVDFQAPESPENKECAPPRGESDEKQLEMPYQIAGQEDPEVQKEQVSTAAETLVSISAFVAQNGLQMATCPPSESFVSDSLHWLARIVSSTMDYPENEVKVDCSGKKADVLEDFLPAGIDYFEAMTLKLTETLTQDCCCKISGLNEKEGRSTSPSRPRKGRTKRGRWQKDFQSEILPSLASLSRYEVTEDLQTIGGLMEAAGTHLETGSLGSAGRNALARRRKRSHTSVSNVTDTVLKQLTNKTELGIEKRGLISWEKICRKPRGQRYPASNPQFFLSQAYN